DKGCRRTLARPRAGEREVAARGDAVYRQRPGTRASEDRLLDGTRGADVLVAEVDQRWRQRGARRRDRTHDGPGPAAVGPGHEVLVVVGERDLVDAYGRHAGAQR